MAEMLLLNPRKRSASRRRRRNPSRTRPSAPLAKRPARRVALRRARRANPASRVSRSVRRAMRRQRNPISLGTSARSAVATLKDSLIGGAGAIAVDLAMGQINPYLPDSLKRTPGQAGVGDAVKMLLTIVGGKVLSKATRGLSMKAAQGALTVQAHGIIASFLPGTMTLGYSVPGQVMQGQARIANMRNGLSRYTQPGVTPLLNRYTQPGVTPLLNGSRQNAMLRDGVHVR